MEPRVNYTVVGLFVIVLAATIIFTVIWLSSGLTGKSYTIYKVYMNESVTGLSVNAPVKYNGVDVGFVKDMKLNHDNPQQVELLLNIEEKTPITKSTTAILTTQGLTGVAYIDLQVRGTDTTPLEAPPGHKYPVIKSAPSLFFRLDKALSDLMANFNSLSYSLNEVLDKENRLAFKHILANVDKLTYDLSGDTKQLDTILKNTATASKKFPGLIQNGQNVTQGLSRQTIPKMNQILNGVENITNNLSDTSRSVKENPSILLRGQEPRPPGPGE